MERNPSDTIVVLGSTGMLGGMLVRCFAAEGYDVRSVSRGEFVIGRDPLSKLDLRGVDYVVNAAGVVNRRLVDGRNQLDALAVNSLFPRQLADRCEAEAVRLIHISTDCVFRGQHGPYPESAEPDANDPYGRSKAWGEPRNALVLRTSIIGPEQRNLYSLLSWFLSQSGACRGFTNHHWSGMTTLQLGRCIHRIVQNDLHQHRLQHIFSDDITKYELLCLISEVFGHDVEVVPTRDAEDKDMRLRTLNPAFVEALEIPDHRQQLMQLLPLYEVMAGRQDVPTR